MQNDELQDFHSCIKDLMEHDSVQSMAQMSHHVNVTCLDHSVFVSYLSYRMCRRLGLDYTAAARGGLLHDLFLYDWRVKGSHEGLHGFTHPKAALKNATAYFALNDKEKDIIVKHMWPMTLSLPKFRESYVVCMADKICALAEMFHLYHLLRMEQKMELSRA